MAYILFDKTASVKWIKKQYNFEHLRNPDIILVICFPSLCLFRICTCTIKFIITFTRQELNQKHDVSDVQN